MKTLPFTECQQFSATHNKFGVVAIPEALEILLLFSAVLIRPIRVDNNVPRLASCLQQTNVLATNLFCGAPLCWKAHVILRTVVSA